MPEQRIWKPLPLARSPGLPVLLVSLSTGPASYSIRVTDTANLWAEDLDRPAISRRGWDSSTSIDPSETPENMARFLNSLRSALDASHPGHDQTSLTLSPNSSEETGENGLIVKVRCSLPGIQPLVWPFHLKKAPPSAMATDLVLPLMEGRHNMKLEVDSLIQALSHKDAVIAKLADKLEAMGTGLENVFTGLSGRRKVTRAHAGDKIRGLAPFETSRWRVSLAQQGERPPDFNAILRGMSEADGLRTETLLEVEASPVLDRWWHSFHTTGSLPPLDPQESAPIGHQETSSKVERLGNGNDAFEGQPMPSHPRPGAKRTAQALNAVQDDESTASENDGATTSVTLSQRSRNSHTANPAPLGIFGKIGGPKATQSPRASGSSAPSPQQRKRPPVIDDDAETASDTASGSEQDDGYAATPTTSSPASRGGYGGGRGDTSMKRGLGRIGGIPRRPQAPDADEGQDSSRHGPPPKKLGAIGRIGGVTSTTMKSAAGASAESGAPDGVERGRDLIKEEKSTQEDERLLSRETSQERRSRRREDFRHAMNKSSAGPVKKKRRF